MTEMDGMEGLRAYVEGRVEEIIGRKEACGILPLTATRLEILQGITDKVTQCMRELHRSGKYRGTNTINYPALVRTQHKEQKP